MSRIRTENSNVALNLFDYRVPTFIVVGERRWLNFTEIERNYNVEFKYATRENVIAHLDNYVVGIIVLEKALERGVKIPFLTELLKQNKYKPVYYIVEKPVDNPTARELYKHGMQGIYRRSNETRVLYESVVESLRPKKNIAAKNRIDKKIAQSVKTMLNISGLPKGLSVAVINGIVYIKGKVSSLYKKHLVENNASKVIGVKKVMLDGVDVKSKARVTDSELERKIKLYVGTLLGESKRSVLVSVKKKKVFLKGKVTKRAHIDDMIEFASKQPGVWHVYSDIKVDEKAAMKRSEKLQKLEEKILVLFEGAKHIVLNRYGNVLEVSGVVRYPFDRGLIEKYLVQTLDVTKVVNKLIVGH